MLPERILEIELLANAHPGHRSSALLHECLAAIRERDQRLAKREKTRQSRASFTPPTFEEAAAEFTRLGLNGESRMLAQEFIAHYNSNGWMVGRVRMRSWPDACVTWKKRHQKQQGATPGAGKAQQPTITRTPEPKL